MRIISGQWKGKRLNAPRNIPARPTTDFAKEALFNILNHKFFLNEVDVLDLFAGIGSISFEFASRGAQRIQSVDANAASMNWIQKTAESLNIKDLSTVKSDVFKFLNRPAHTEFDIIFADPPFEFSDDDYVKIIQLIFENNWLAENGLFVLEHGARRDFSESPNFVEHKKYGNVHFSFFE